MRMKMLIAVMAQCVGALAESNISLHSLLTPSSVARRLEAGCTASVVDAQAHSSNGDPTVLGAAHSFGPYIEEGSHLDIRAYGTWGTGGGHPRYSAGGSHSLPYGPFNRFSLVASVGDGALFQAGRSVGEAHYQGFATASGSMHYAFWDSGNRLDNEGSMDVRLCVTPPPCPAGTHRASPWADCLPLCLAGHEWDASASSCSPCPAGHYSRAGQQCLPTLYQAVGSRLEPTLAVTWNRLSQVTLTLTLDPLPTPIYDDGLSIEYRLDMQEAEANLGEDGTCFSMPSDAEATRSLSYDDLSGPDSDCVLGTDETSNPDLISRDGFIAVYIVSVSADTPAVVKVERKWTIPVHVQFERETIGTSSIFEVVGTATLDAQEIPLGAFDSTLKLYTDAAFLQEWDGAAEFALGDAVYVRHYIAEASDKLDLEITAAVLSSPTASLNDVARDLFPTILRLDSGEPSEARFVFTAGGCEDDCFLTVISRVDHQGRRLSGRRLGTDGMAVHALSTIPVTMSPVPEAMQLSLTMVVRGIDYSALATRPSLHERFVGKLKSTVVDHVGDLISEDDLLVSLAPGSVKADVVIRATADDILAIKTMLADPAVQSTVKEDVTQSVVAMESVHLISNSPISTEWISVEIVEVAPDGVLRHDHSRGVPSWVIAIVVVVSLVVVLTFASACFLCYRTQRKRQYSQKETVAERSKECGACPKKIITVDVADAAPMDAEVRAESKDNKVRDI